MGLPWKEKNNRQMDDIKFEKAKQKVINSIDLSSSIGRLQEKSVHSVLKYFFEPDDNNHEVKAGTHIADILLGNVIYEIQTRQFNKLTSKLSEFTAIGYKVIVVYPVVVKKQIVWLDKDSYEIVGNIKTSPKKGSELDIFSELYKIKPFINHAEVSFKIVRLTASEYRLLDGYGNDNKKGATKFDIIPDELLEVIEINHKSDLLKLLPSPLPDEFSSLELSQLIHKKDKKLSNYILNVLHSSDIITFSEKKGRLHYYKLKQHNP